MCKAFSAQRFSWVMKTGKTVSINKRGHHPFASYTSTEYHYTHFCLSSKLKYVWIFALKLHMWPWCASVGWVGKPRFLKHYLMYHQLCIYCRPTRNETQKKLSTEYCSLIPVELAQIIWKITKGVFHFDIFQGIIQFKQL